MSYVSFLFFIEQGPVLIEGGKIKRGTLIDEFLNSAHSG